MCVPMMALVAGAQVGAAGFQAYSQIAEGGAKKRYYNYLSQQSEATGEAKLKAARQESEFVQVSAADKSKRLAISGAELTAEQRAAAAANNLSGSGTTQDIAKDTARKLALDQSSLKYNAATKSWEIESSGEFEKWKADEQAKQYKYAGRQAKRASYLDAFSTLLGSSSQIAGTLGKLK